MELSKATSVNSRAEELFVQLFCEAFGPEKTENLQLQYPCVDIYGRHRYRLCAGISRIQNCN